MAKTEYKNVTKISYTKVYYEGKITYNKKTYTGRYPTAIEAAKFVDMTCIKLGIPQRNNLFSKKS